METMMLQQIVQQPDFSQVPTRFIQSELSKPASPSHLQIPIIDMAGLDGAHKDQVVNEIGRACEDWGFFQVINHGVDPTLMEDLKKVAQDFFALRPEEKAVNAIKPGTGVGYGRFFETSESVANWADNLILYTYGQSLKRTQPCMPPKPEQFSNVINEYGIAIFKLCIQLMEVLSVSLGLEPHVIAAQAKAFESGAGIRTDFNYYPPCPQPELVLGTSPHADRGVLTILQQGGTPGLEISKDGMWFPVPPVKDAFVINLGDQMQIMSNSKYKSVLHRALVNQSISRYSFANFLIPAIETVIEPIKELLSEDCPPVYRPVSFGEYTDGYLFKPLQGKRQLDTFVIPTKEFIKEQ